MRIQKLIICKQKTSAIQASEMDRASNLKVLHVLGYAFHEVHNLD